MKLPNANNAIVERKKIVDYLLDPAHPDNSGKAEFLEALGFRRKEWEPWQRRFCIGAAGGSGAKHEVAARPKVCYHWSD